MNKDFWDKLNKLEELAEKATPGTWIIKNDPEDRYDYDIAFITTTERQNASIGEIAQVSCYEPDIIEEPIVKEQIANAEYISAANPAMIMAMIDELKCLLLDNSTANMDLQVARHQAQKMAANNMKLHERLTNLQKELNDAKAKLGDKNRRIKILEEDLSRLKEYSRNSNKIERLENEADWLAKELASVYKSEFEGTMDFLDASGWREAARKAISGDK